GRVACFQLAEIYASKEFYEEARAFMKLGLSYVDKIETDILKVEYQYIDAITSNEEDKQIKLIQAAAHMENIENLEIKWKIYKAIAQTYQSRKEYQDALKYYISALNILRKLVHNVPDEYKTTFVLSHGRNTVKEGLRDISKMIMKSKGINFDVQKDTNKITLQNLDKYFDYTNYIDIYREGEEVSEAKVDAGTYNKLLNKIRDLIIKFSENNIENIKNIVDLCTEITQAKNAFIAILDEEDNLDILASYNRYSETSFYKYVIEQVKQKKDSIIVTDVFDYNNNKGDILIPKEITAVFCIPIIGTKDEDELGLLKERRKQKQQNESNIIGYIYLDTDSIINNFTQESIHFCKLLGKVAYILVDNYNLKIVSTVDKLTKLYTRKYFETALQSEIDYGEKEGMEFSVIMIDIDNFKTVNDRFGHQRGDEILQGVSGTILNALRKGDIAARYGGEEIIILLPNTGEEEGINVAEKLRKKVENARLLGLHNPLTISVGVSTYPTHSTWAKDLIEKADQALYYAKENGKNFSCLYKEDMSKTTKRIDKLAGIISGNLVEDQRKVETMLEVLELQRSIDISKGEKLFNFLGRIIEVSEAQLGIIFNIGEMGEIRKKIVRKKFITTEVEEEYYNKEVVSKCIE
ncbi:MAG: GGDEF domain-containing protein, partial [Lutisporaceae bacterium]